MAKLPEQIIGAGLQAVGGDAWLHVKAIRRDAELRIAGDSGRAITWWASPDKFCHLAYIGDTKIRVATDGTFGWFDTAPANAIAINNWRTYGHIISNRYLFRGQYHSAQHMGMRQVRGNDADIINIELPLGQKISCSFDRVCHWLVREYSHHSAPGIDNLLIESFYDDYRRVGNVMMPFHFGEIVPTVSSDTRPVAEAGDYSSAHVTLVAELRVTFLELNTLIPDAIFSPMTADSAWERET